MFWMVYKRSIRSTNASQTNWNWNKCCYSMIPFETYLVGLHLRDYIQLLFWKPFDPQILTIATAITTNVVWQSISIVCITILIVVLAVTYLGNFIHECWRSTSWLAILHWVKTRNPFSDDLACISDIPVATLSNWKARSPHLNVILIYILTVWSC